VASEPNGVRLAVSPGHVLDNCVPVTRSRVAPPVKRLRGNIRRRDQRGR
jgi:hypothetical protein